MSEDLREEVAALRAEVAALRAQLGTTGMRLGPRPETPEDVKKRTALLIDAVARTAADRLIDAVPNVEPVDRSNRCTTSGKPIADDHREIDPATGMQKDYIVLCADERAKGFVRPYRDSYKHLTCGAVTTMGRSLSETYARDPSFYSGTFCATCRAHFLLTEFVWTADGIQVGL